MCWRWKVFKHWEGVEETLAQSADFLTSHRFGTKLVEKPHWGLHTCSSFFIETPTTTTYISKYHLWLVPRCELAKTSAQHLYTTLFNAMSPVTSSHPEKDSIFNGSPWPLVIKLQQPTSPLPLEEIPGGHPSQQNDPWTRMERTYSTHQI